MITEDELKAIEGMRHPMYFNGAIERTITKLIAEVRRLNAVIRRAYAATETNKPYEIRAILEPESEDK